MSPCHSEVHRRDRERSSRRQRSREFVFLGSAAGVASGNPSTAAAQFEPDQANANLGYSVAGAGADDVVVGSRFYDAGQNNEGAAFAYLGRTSTHEELPTLSPRSRGALILVLIACALGTSMYQRADLARS